jgi:HK97 gp10 family phage protein
MKVTGLAGALNVFEHYSKDKPKKIRQARVKTARYILNYAKKLAPKQTGKLRNSGTVDNTLDNSKITFNADYAPYIEFGTGGLVEIPAGFEELAIEFYQGSRSTRAKNIQMSPQPFLIPAFLNGSQIYKEQVEIILKE